MSHTPQTVIPPSYAEAAEVLYQLGKLVEAGSVVLRQDYGDMQDAEPTGAPSWYGEFLQADEETEARASSLSGIIRQLYHVASGNRPLEMKPVPADQGYGPGELDS